ncbi:MAG: hypothetical protein KDD73_06095 [Anaerolineales bacterium]|nr:hypothetical protein [Anaerolineales bacterium]MCB9129281.1 uridine kinase [Ardenticatenales bacterium]
MSSQPRAALLRDVAARLLALPAHRPQRIAIDGVDGAGKTTFANELAAQLAPTGRAVIRASVDGFHHPAAVRYRQGRRSPRGFFEDSYDYEALERLLLHPLGPGGDRRYRTACFDHRTDSAVEVAAQIAPNEALLLFDGIFLHRTRLRPFWDFSLFLDVPFDISIPRGAQRGEGYGAPDVRAASNHRYIVGQRLYLRYCQPKRHATLVIDNRDLAWPKLL